MPKFDRSFLPPAQLEVVVLGDTHFILDAEAYAVEFDSVRQWPARAAYALQCAADMGADLVVHLGDISEEPPEHKNYGESRRIAQACMQRLGLTPRVVAGNMDVGDKPDPTMWTPPASARSLANFHAQFGPSWYSFDAADCHFVVVNSQVLNGDLPEAAEQARWLEADLASNRGRRVFLFLHMPPFFVEEDEPDTGFYNSIDEPARSWLTTLFRRHNVEAVFCGHTHFRAFNRVADTRIYVCPSTTTSRAGFYEAFSVAPPPEQGRNDPPKLGFCLLRVLDGGARVHFIRTAGRTEPDPAEQGWAQLVTRTSADLPDSPLGVYLRTPLTRVAPGALAWPGVKRQSVRDDHPFLHILELGARHVRVPCSDLTDPEQRQRLAMLRDEGVAVTAVWVHSRRLDLVAELRALAWQPDALELQLPGEVIPPGRVCDQLRQARAVFEGPISLAPYLPRERAPGRYHPRGRMGYLPHELSDLDAHLRASGLTPCRAVCTLPPDDTAAQTLTTLAHAASDLAHVAGLDLIAPLPPDPALRLSSLTSLMSAAAERPGCRVFLDPFVDLDRTNDRHRGLIDRLGNPHPEFHLVRALNTILFSGVRRWRCAASPTELNDLAAPATVIDLVRGLVCRADDAAQLADRLDRIAGPCAATQH